MSKHMEQEDLTSLGVGQFFLDEMTFELRLKE